MRWPSLATPAPLPDPVSARSGNLADDTIIGFGFTPAKFFEALAHEKARESKALRDAHGNQALSD